MFLGIQFEVYALNEQPYAQLNLTHSAPKCNLKLTVFICFLCKTFQNTFSLAEIKKKHFTFR